MVMLSVKWIGGEEAEEGSTLPSGNTKQLAENNGVQRGTPASIDIKQVKVVLFIY